MQPRQNYTSMRKISFAELFLVFGLLVLGLAMAVPVQGKYILPKEKRNSLKGITQVTSFKKVAGNGIVHQSAANYGKYLFMVQDKLAGITLYDLEKAKPLFHLSLTPYEERNYIGTGSVLYHCNNTSFGTEFFDRNDVFPLLYVTQRQVKESLRAFVVVLRIVPHFGPEQEIDSFSAERVQTIYMPGMSEKNRLGHPNIIIDRKRNDIVTYSRYNNSNSKYDQLGRITRLRLPSLRNANGEIQQTVYLDDKDITDSFDTEWNMTYAQGGFVQGDLLVIGQGFPTKKHAPVNVRVIDLKKRKTVGTTNIYDMGFDDEPEGVFLYKGKVMVSSIRKNIYVLDFARQR